MHKKSEKHKATNRKRKKPTTTTTTKTAITATTKYTLAFYKIKSSF